MVARRPLAARFCRCQVSSKAVTARPIVTDRPQSDAVTHDAARSYPVVVIEVLSGECLGARAVGLSSRS